MQIRELSRYFKSRIEFSYIRYAQPMGSTDFLHQHSVLWAVFPPTEDGEVGPGSDVSFPLFLLSRDVVTHFELHFELEISSHRVVRAHLRTFTQYLWF